MSHQKAMLMNERVFRSFGELVLGERI